jgi:hypothetical protein
MTPTCPTLTIGLWDIMRTPASLHGLKGRGRGHGLAGDQAGLAGIMRMNPS